MAFIRKTEGTTTMIDVAVPLDWKVKHKDDALMKYEDIRIEILLEYDTKANVIIS